MVACDNLKCKQVVQLEPDGSPPLFCSGCGSKISLSLFEIEPIIGRDCQNCGKVVMKRLDGAVAIYCSRCGFSTFTIEGRYFHAIFSFPVYTVDLSSHVC